MRNPATANTRGATLTELMIATVLITVAALGIMGVFSGVAKGIQVSKARSLASNLAQEKIQILKQKNYYRVLVTTAAAFQTDFTPNIPYDPGYFPMENIVEGGIRFQRLTYIQYAQEVSGNMQTVAATSADTNIKLITVTVVWRQGPDSMRLQVRSVMSNPDATMMSAVVRGKVTVGGVDLANALITVAENSGWQDTTDTSGNYLINVYPGNYNLSVSARGYFPDSASINVSTTAAITQNFALTQMDTRTLSGDVWVSDHLVISKVMGSSDNAAGFNQEFVEIYNPTTWTWAASGALGLKFARRAVQDIAVKDIDIDYAGSPATIDPGEYFLFANTRPLELGGAVLMPDAVWDADGASPNAFTFNDEIGRWDSTPGSENYNVITVDGDFGGGPNSAAGGLILYDLGTGTVWDRVGWSGNAAQNPRPEVYESLAIPEVVGLQPEEHYRRKAAPAGISATWGPAYDSGTNLLDWVNAGSLTQAPFTNASSTKTPVTGVPAVNAVVSVNDGLSIPARALSTGVPPRARFTINSVATGTWTLFAALGTAYEEVGNVVVPTGAGTIWVTSGTTTPAWRMPNEYAVYLTTPTDEGYISGTVLNAGGTAISPAITVTNGSRTTTASTGDGTYLLKAPAGTYSVYANPNNVNPSFVSASSAAVTVNIGQVTSGVNFVLSQGGQVLGYVTRDGTNPLPGIAVRAQMGGLARGQEVSAADGSYRLVNMSTGSYTLTPVLAAGESASPTSITTDVVLGVQVFAGTFTITGAMGTIRGSVTASGRPIQTGALVVATTATIAGAPPALDINTLAGNAYYSAASSEDGSYAMEVRGVGSNYNVYAYYSNWNGASWIISTGAVTGVAVTPGATTSGVNFAW